MADITHVLVKPRGGRSDFTVKDDEFDVLKTNYHLTSEQLDLLVRQAVLHTDDHSFFVNG